MTIPSTTIVSSLEETHLVAKALGESLKTASCLVFFGDLGAGKTTFIKELASLLADIDPSEVVSPTFQYLNIYKGRTTVYHFDLYRLRSSEDFLLMGFEELFTPNGVTCIEWAEKISDIIPESAISVTIRVLEEGKRSIQIERWGNGNDKRRHE